MFDSLPEVNNNNQPARMHRPVNYTEYEEQEEVEISEENVQMLIVLFSSYCDG